MRTQKKLFQRARAQSMAPRSCEGWGGHRMWSPASSPPTTTKRKPTNRFFNSICWLFFPLFWVYCHVCLKFLTRVFRFIIANRLSAWAKSVWNATGRFFFYSNKIVCLISVWSEGMGIHVDWITEERVPRSLSQKSFAVENDDTSGGFSFPFSNGIFYDIPVDKNRKATTIAFCHWLYWLAIFAIIIVCVSFEHTNI